MSIGLIIAHSVYVEKIYILFSTCVIVPTPLQPPPPNVVVKINDELADILN